MSGGGNVEHNHRPCQHGTLPYGVAVLTHSDWPVGRFHAPQPSSAVYSCVSNVNELTSYIHRPTRIRRIHWHRPSRFFTDKTETETGIGLFATTTRASIKDLISARRYAIARYELSYMTSAFFVKEYFPVPSSGGNQCKNRHAPIWHFG